MIGIAIDINPLINPYIIGYGNGQNSENWYTNHKPEGGANFTWSLDTKNYDDKYLVKRDTKNNAPSTWSENEKKAAVFADSEVLRIFEKYGWKWNCGGWYPNATYPQNVDNDTQHFDFIGMPEEIKQKGSQWNYTDSSNLQLVNGSSGSYDNDNGSGTRVASNTTYYIKYASWSQTVIKEEYDQKDPLKNRKDNTKVINNMTSRTFNYQGLLNGYTLPFNYLWAWLVITEDKDFVMGLADLAYNSDIEITIHDSYSENVTNTTDTYFEDDMEMKAGKVIPTRRQYTKKITTILKNASQMNDLTKANVWIVDYIHTYKLVNGDWEEAEKNIVPKDKEDSEKENFITLINKYPKAKERYKEWKETFYEIIQYEENGISDMEDITKYLMNIESDSDYESDDENEESFDFSVFDPVNFKTMSWEYINSNNSSSSSYMSTGGNRTIIEAANEIYQYMQNHDYQYCSDICGGVAKGYCTHQGSPGIVETNFEASKSGRKLANCTTICLWSYQMAGLWPMTEKNINNDGLLKERGFQKIYGRENLQPGDILFFIKINGEHHWELYAGDDKVYNTGNVTDMRRGVPAYSGHWSEFKWGYRAP